MSALFCEGNYDAWLAQVYDSWYAELHDPAKGPASAIKALLDMFPGIAARAPADISVLDCACGTGNLYMALSRLGYDVWGCDGSQAMLERAAANCERENVSRAQLVADPVRWTDAAAYHRCFVSRGKLFDVILLNSNSLCHLPAVPGQLDVALANFHSLLKPGGRLIIDTKKYKEDRFADGTPLYRELKYENGAWIPRTTRPDGQRVLSDGSEVNFDTSLHYDIDPYFEICRALLIVTISRPSVGPETHVMPYFPLPSSKLAAWLDKASFGAKLFEAKTSPLFWSYDCIVAEKR